MELLRNPVNVFPGITTFFNIAKPKPLMNPIFTSQLNYSPLIFPLDVSQFHGLNNKTSRLHEKYLRVVYNGNRASFEDQLDKDESASIHVDNLHTLTLEMFKVAKNLSALIVSEIFEKRNKVQRQQNPSKFVISLKVCSIFDGIKSISYLDLPI